jgi:uncharacterized membrane protein
VSEQLPEMLESSDGRILSWVKQQSPLTWLAFVLCAAYALWTAELQIDAHRGLGTFSYDIGLYDQGVWLLSRFKAPFVTLMGRNLLGDHASFVLLLLIPLYWLGGGTETLLVVQAVVIASGAIPVYFFARRVLRSEGLAVLMVVAWLANPAVNGTNFENFHPDSFLALFLPMALYAALSKKWRLYVVAVVLCLLVKEDVVLVLAPMGTMLWLRGERRRGVATVVASVGATVIGMFVVMKSLIGEPTRNGWRIPYGGITGLMKESVLHPVTLLKYLGSDGRLSYLWQLGAPMAFVFLLAPEVAMVSILVVLSNMVSTFWYQHSIMYHYSLVVIPGLLFAVMVAASRMKWSPRVFVVCVVAATSVLTSLRWSPLPVSANARIVWRSDNPIAVAGREIIKKIPDGAMVSASDPLIPHIAHRTTIYMFPNPFFGDLYGVDNSLDGKRLPDASKVQYVVLAKTLDHGLQWDWEVVKGDFSVIAENQFWAVYERTTMMSSH